MNSIALSLYAPKRFVASKRQTLPTHVDTVQFGAKQQKLDLQPLRDAALSGDLETVLQWIKDGKSVEDRNRNKHSPLMLASFRNNFPEARLKMVKALIQAGADVNLRIGSGNTPLSIAVKEDAPMEIIQCLLENGAKKDINNKNEDQITALGYASYRGDRQIFDLLRASGAKTDPYELTQCFSAALYNGKADLAAHMINQFPDLNLNQKDRFGQTPLISAAKSRNPECLELLLNGERAKEIGLNERDGSLNTALHKAIWEGVLENVQLLVEAGADLQAKNKYKQTPYQLAEKCVIHAVQKAEQAKERAIKSQMTEDASLYNSAYEAAQAQAETAQEIYDYLMKKVNRPQA